jgi:Domain of unknown function (DUF4249)
MNPHKLILFVILLSACKDKYDFPLKSSDVSLLVVEGVMNAGKDTTVVSLSRSVKINDTAVFYPVASAKVSVESKNGAVYTLLESGNGKYAGNQLPLVIGQEYRLHIKTADNKEYFSDYVTAKQTPPVDSVSWKIESDGLHIYVNTHDPANSTRYYKWDYEETWEIRSHLGSFFQYLGNGQVAALSSPYHTRCWKYSSSTNFNLGTTIQLQNDVVSEKLLQLVPWNSEKLSVRYSILVKQQALSKEAYEYMLLMKKNNESLGSIFDVQPSALSGNIHCVSNPSEQVIGFITASSVPEKRIFITGVELNWRYAEDCSDILKVFKNSDSIKLVAPAYLPYGDAFPEPYYYFAPASCVDCVVRGGDLNIPGYW